MPRGIPTAKSDGLALAKAVIDFFETYNIAARVEKGQEVLMMARRMVEQCESGQS